MSHRTARLALADLCSEAVTILGASLWRDLRWTGEPLSKTLAHAATWRPGWHESRRPLCSTEKQALCSLAESAARLETALVQVPA